MKPPETARNQSPCPQRNRRNRFCKNRFDGFGPHMDSATHLNSEQSSPVGKPVNCPARGRARLARRAWGELVDLASRCAGAPALAGQRAAVPAGRAAVELGKPLTVGAPREKALDDPAMRYALSAVTASPGRTELDGRRLGRRLGSHQERTGSGLNVHGAADAAPGGSSGGRRVASRETP